MLRRLLPLTLVLALTGSLLALPAAGAGGPTSAAKGKAKGAGKGKKCGKGKKLVTVVKGGKGVKKCKKKGKGKPKAVCSAAGGASASCAIPPLFEPPGRRLEGEEAKPFLQKYLANSTFTDCPAGWPNCAVEERYSHAADGSFYYCRLTPTPGSDIRFGSEYEVKNAVVEADGSWAFNELVPSGGNPSLYEWRVTANGTVTGAYQFNGGAIEQLGPFQYVPGAKDCSY
jgi:hypothetical protein